MHARPAGDAHPADVRIDDCALGDDVASHVVGVGVVLEDGVDGRTDGLALLGVVDVDFVNGEEPDGLGPGPLAVVLAMVLVTEVGELVLARDLGPALASIVLQAAAAGLATRNAMPLCHASRRPTALISMDWRPTRRSLKQPALWRRAALRNRLPPGTAGTRL